MKLDRDEPGQEGRHHADDEGSDRHVHAAFAGQQLACLEQPGPGGDRGGHQERESGRRLAVHPDQPARGDRDPRPTDPGHERERLGDTDADRDRESHVLDTP